MGGNCNLFLAPSDGEKPHRTYLFKSDGMIQVADTYNIPGKDTVTTGTATFFIFPRSGNPTAKIISLPDPSSKTRDLIQQIRVKLPSGDAIIFSTGQQATPISKRKLPLISSGEGGIDISEDPIISPANKGGVIIKPNVGSSSIVLDVGYTRGNKPAFLNPNGTSLFKDSGNHVCTVSNSLLFKKTGGFDAAFAFKNDASLFSFIRSHCPKEFQVPARQTTGTNGGGRVGGSAGSLSPAE
jgi:hypothetical protein